MSSPVSVPDCTLLMFLGSRKITLLKHIAGSDHGPHSASVLHTWHIQRPLSKTMNIKWLKRLYQLGAFSWGRKGCGSGWVSFRSISLCHKNMSQNSLLHSFPTCLLFPAPRSGWSCCRGRWQLWGQSCLCVSRWPSDTCVFLVLSRARCPRKSHAGVSGDWGSYTHQHPAPADMWRCPSTHAHTCAHTQGDAEACWLPVNDPVC